MGGNFDHSSPCYWAYPKYMNVVIPEESHHAPDMPVLGVTVTENILSGSTDTTIVHHFEDMPFNSFYDERTTGRSEVEIFWI